MRTYFKAEIYLSTELFVNNDLSQGCDPDSWQNNGLCATYEKPSLNELVKVLKSNYGDSIEHFEDNRYDTSYEITERDGTHIHESVSIYITEVSEVPFSNENLFKDGM